MTIRQAVKSSLGLLSPRDRRLLSLSIAIQMATSLLDLIGVLLIGIVGALAVTTVQSQPPMPSVERVIDTLGMQDLSNQSVVLILAGAAAITLLSKSIISAFLTRRVFIFLANRQALVCGRLIRELLSRPLSFLQKRSSQETSYALITGAAAATSLVLGQLVIAVTEFALLAVLGVALVLVSPLVAVGSIVFFALVALGLQKAMGDWASRVGRSSSLADIESFNVIQEALGTYREIVVSNRRALYVSRIQELRWRAAKVSAESQFIGMFPKYMFEAALVIGGFILAAVLIATQDATVAVGTLALFLAAGTRVMPSLMRLQGAMLMLRSGAGTASQTFALAEDLGNPTSGVVSGVDETELALAIRSTIASGYRDFVPQIVISDASFRYTGASDDALSHISLRIEPGQSLALIGRSGAGKSTMADIILGVLTPDSGEVLLGDEDPGGAVARWPGAIAYVPQEVVLTNDTVRANVALGLPPDAIDDEFVWEALARARLDEYLLSQRDGLDTHIGEGGLRLSGGQRQRLGIARALFTKPRLLVLDEATSALDVETEHAITDMIDDLEGEVTTVIIAHRLSTVRHADQVVYLDNGRAIALGTFDEVRHQVPALDRQADLMGFGPLRRDDHG